MGVPLSVIDYNAPGANSPQFTRKNQLLAAVSDNLSVYPSGKAARADFTSGTDVKAPSCFAADLNGAGKTELDAQFGAGTKVGTVTVTRTPASDFAPHAANLTMFFPLTTQGTTVNVEIIEVDVVSGNEEQTVSLTAVESTFPTSLERHLTTVAAGRI
jgi:hypothetical protein